MANSVDPDQTAPAVCSGSTLFASILYSSVMLGNYLQQTTSADNIFRCIFWGALRVKMPTGILKFITRTKHDFAALSKNMALIVCIYKDFKVA